MWDDRVGEYSLTTVDDLESTILNQTWFTPNQMGVYIDGQNSCPAGKGGPLRLPQRVPDPWLWMAMEDREIDVRFVFLSRSFDACVFSALRRGHTRDVEMQLRVE